jgi:pimeloyl-ACP methyl ester carboxylesterase
MRSPPLSYGAVTDSNRLFASLRSTSSRQRTPLHAVFEMYRAFPANLKLNSAQREPINVPLLVGAGDGPPFANLVPKEAEGLRTNGCAHVETGLIHGAVHYVVEDQPNEVAAPLPQSFGTICVEVIGMYVESQRGLCDTRREQTST